MFLLQKLYVLENLLIKSISKSLLQFLSQFRHLNFNKVLSTFIYSRLDLQSTHSLCNPSERLSTKLDNEVHINLQLSINFNLCEMFTIFSPPSISFFVIFLLIFTEKVICLSVFSPKKSNSLSNSLTSSLIIK